MGAFLTVLNIIGIIALVLLFILLFLLVVFAYIICAPLYYKIAVTHKSKTEYKFKISTFLRTVIVSGDSTLKDPITLRILWIFRKKLNMASSGEKSEESLKEKTLESSDAQTDETSKEKPDNNKETNTFESSKSEKRRFKKERKAERWKRIKSLWVSIKDFKNYPHKKTVLKATLKLLKEIINAIKPKKLKIKCLFGMSNPFDTGITLAAISSIKPFIKVSQADQILVEADFENEIFEIDIHAKGWFNLLSIILPTIRFVRVKPIWKIIKSVL